MPRQHIATKGDKRIPLSEFHADITILRVHSAPSQTDESWVKSALKLGNFAASYEAGEEVIVKGNRSSSKNDYLFVLHHEDEYVFTPQDYVIYGKEAFVVRSTLPFRSGGRRYLQINTRPWGKVSEGDFTIDPAAPVPERITSPDTGNLFWEEESGEGED